MTIESIRSVDPQVYELIRAEERRQRDVIRLIASENYASDAVLAATGSVLANKYSEGYSGRRYYQGQLNTDALERLAISRAKDMFGAEHVNVQPYSGSPANMAVYLGLLEPGDSIVGLSLPHGGHLTHGWKVNFSGKLFKASQYGVNQKTELIDLAEVRAVCKEAKPKLISIGCTAYPRVLDFAGFAEIAEEFDAILMADVAHICGLIAGGVHPNPVPYAHVTTTTTHKTLRGPRGGMIMCRKDLARPINRAVFPGLQGGPHMNQIAGLCVALKEAASPDFKAYAQQIVDNARSLAEALSGHGFRLVTGGTDNHLVLIDLTPKGVGGKPAAQALERAGIVCNYNSVPFDTRKPFDPSGIRLGTPSLTSRGMKEADMVRVAGWMNTVVENLENTVVEERIRMEVEEFLGDFPAPGLPQ